MAQIEASNDDGINPATGNQQASKVTGMNELIRGALNKKRFRFDTLGRLIEEEGDDDSGMH